MMLRNSKLKLDSLSPEKKLNDHQQYLSQLTDRLHYAMNQKYESYARRLEVSIARLDGLSPTAKLKGGFGYIESRGEAVHSATQVQSGDEIAVTLHDGIIEAIVK